MKCLLVYGMMTNTSRLKMFQCCLSLSRMITKTTTKSVTQHYRISTLSPKTTAKSKFTSQIMLCVDLFRLLELIFQTVHVLLMDFPYICSLFIDKLSLPMTVCWKKMKFPLAWHLKLYMKTVPLAAVVGIWMRTMPIIYSKRNCAMTCDMFWRDSISNEHFIGCRIKCMSKSVKYITFLTNEKRRWNCHFSMNFKFQ